MEDRPDLKAKVDSHPVLARIRALKDEYGEAVQYNGEGDEALIGAGVPYAE